MLHGRSKQSQTTWVGWIPSHQRFPKHEVSAQGFSGLVEMSKVINNKHKQINKQPFS